MSSAQNGVELGAADPRLQLLQAADEHLQVAGQRVDVDRAPAGEHRAVDGDEAARHRVADEHRRLQAGLADRAVHERQDVLGGVRQLAWRFAVAGQVEHEHPAVGVDARQLAEDRLPGAPVEGQPVQQHERRPVIVDAVAVGVHAGKDQPFRFGGG